MSALDPMEALENPLTVLLGNPHPGIADLQFYSLLRRLQRDGHGALFAVDQIDPTPANAATPVLNGGCRDLKVSVSY
jgi:hypothetical protein